MQALCDDLAAEHAALDAVVADLDEARWDLATPAKGWSVRDQIAHLAYTDVAGYLAAVEPETFARDLAALPREARQGRQLAIGRAMTALWLGRSRRGSRARRRCPRTPGRSSTGPRCSRRSSAPLLRSGWPRRSRPAPQGFAQASRGR